ncbi:MAG: type I methionyl aminopeptidase [Planctomycetes bacterium]|nr:type I methionyl aminopeptidase [Planctomycetota bacterium]
MAYSIWQRVYVSKHRPNDPCYCGSGKKYKKCHMHKDSMSETSASGLQKNRRPVQRGVISPMRSVPDAIGRPEYALDSQPFRGKITTLIKTSDEIERMRAAGLAARRVLDLVGAAVKPGITTEDLDIIAHEAYIAEGGYPSPLNYRSFPKSICTSVNEVICHGIPDNRTLIEGDTVNCDITIYLNGVHGDCSKTFFVGTVSDQDRKLVEATEESLNRAMATVYNGSRLSDIGRAIEDYINPLGYSIVRDFVGHGIGTYFHMDPQVPHYYAPGARKVTLKTGMCFTIEPMINIGVPHPDLWDDKWTAVTADLQRSAQFEHTLLVTDTGVEILTIAEGEQQLYLNNKSK